MEVARVVPVSPSVINSDSAPQSLQGDFSADAGGFGALFQQLTASFMGADQVPNQTSQDPATLLASLTSADATVNPLLNLSPEESAAFRTMLHSDDSQEPTDSDSTQDPLLALQALMAQIQQLLPLLLPTNTSVPDSTSLVQNTDKNSTRSLESFSEALKQLSAKLDEIMNGLTASQSQNLEAAAGDSNVSKSTDLASVTIPVTTPNAATSATTIVQEPVLQQQVAVPLLAKSGELNTKAQKLLKKIEAVIQTLNVAEKVPLKADLPVVQSAMDSKEPLTATTPVQPQLQPRADAVVGDEMSVGKENDAASPVQAHVVETAQGKVHFQEITPSPESSALGTFDPKNTIQAAATSQPQSNQAERIQAIQDLKPLHQVTAKVQFLVLNGEGKATLRLDPPELGHVEIQVDSKPGELKIHMTVENEGVKNMLESSISKLRESLEQQNIKVQHLEVQVDSNGANLQNNGREAQRRNQRNSNSNRGMRFAEVTLAPVTSDTGRRLGYNTMELIA